MQIALFWFFGINLRYFLAKSKKLLDFCKLLLGINLKKFLILINFFSELDYIFKILINSPHKIEFYDYFKWYPDLILLKGLIIFYLSSIRCLELKP